LQRIVQSALGIRNQTNAPRQDEITLEEIEFNNRPLTEITRVFEQQDRRQFWWDLARNVIYPVLGLGILFAFWRAYRRTPAPEIPIGIPLGELGTNGHGNGNGSGTGNGQGSHGGTPKRQEPGVVTVDVLNQLIREQPDNMTQAVRSWLNRNPSDSNSS
jgi:flagellar biosynthesis/type III secretory pathway M-ring protein FliF/YscJ